MHSETQASTNKKQQTSIYLYIPNIIDYFRFVFMIISFYFSYSNPTLFLIFYFLSFALDFFDGQAARRLNQCSRLGSCLDMIVDRLSTMGLLYILGTLYPLYNFVFLLLIILDIGSHWLQSYSSLIFMMYNKDLKLVNHKMLKEKYYLLDVYYKNGVVLFSCCLGAEMFLLGLYWIYFNSHILGFGLFKLIFFISFIVYIYKQFMSVLQILSAANRIVLIDEEEKNE